MSVSRPLYRPDELARLFAPRSIAVVGVSTNPQSFGSITYANIAGPGRFAGAAYRVNAKYERIGDAPCYASIAALPETPDCVFIAVGREETTDCHYPDIDMHLPAAIGEPRRKDGSRF